MSPRYVQSVLAAIWVGLFAYFLGHQRSERAGLPRRLHAARDPGHDAAADPAGHRVDCDHRLLPCAPFGRGWAASRTLIAPIIAFVAQVYFVYLLVAEPRDVRRYGRFGSKNSADFAAAILRHRPDLGLRVASSLRLRPTPRSGVWSSQSLTNGFESFTRSVPSHR